ncbi:MAG: proteasome-type protease [Magnetococcales bacterium]|nr:proteasome-type protease [Magnetococcales bacterium]
MSYCLGMRLDEGLIFLSDSRTNAGVDSVARFRKCFVYERPHERVIVILTAGNLAVTQAVIGLLEESLEADEPESNIMTTPSLYEAARLVGRAVRTIHDQDGEAMRKHGADFNASFIMGGQIKGRRMRLFQIYSAGNFIEASEETPYFQIGETKYGKPILQRVVTARTPLNQAVKCALVSFDSTIRSNLSVGAPLDLVVCPVDSQTVALRRWIQEDDPYFRHLRKKWGEGLTTLFQNLPDSWEE